MTEKFLDENKVILAGRLTQDATLKYTLSKLPVLKFTLAVNTYIKEKKETLYIEIVAFGNLALEVSSLVKRGVPVKVEGRLVSQEVKLSEKERYKRVRVIANKIEVFQK